MRSRSLIATLVVVLAAASGCVGAIDDPDDTPTASAKGTGSKLEASVRDPIVERIRALLPGRNITRLPKVALAGDGARKDAIIKLGRALVFDKILSDNHDISCMTCHAPARGTDEDRHLPEGVRGTGVGPERTGGLTIARNAPPLFDLHAMDSLFWDGRVERLADGSYRTPAGAQLTPAMTSVFELGALSAIGMFPVTSRDEMREHGPDGRFDDLTSVADTDFTGIWEAEMNRLRAIPAYRTMFGKAYPSWPGSESNRIDTMTFAHASNAMAAYIASEYDLMDSPWDDFLAGKNDAFAWVESWTALRPPMISELSVLRGAERFLQTCANCHNGPTLSDERFHNTAVAQLGPGAGDGELALDDFGRARVATDASARCGNPGSGASCRYAFRTTPLRNVLLTAPFGHAGEFGRPTNDPDFLTDLHADYGDLRAFVAHYAVDPAANLRAYDVSQIDEALQPSLLANTEDIIAHIDPLFATGSPVALADVDDLTAFMFALTSKKLLDKGDETGSSRQLALCKQIPPSVPSGLPVDGDPYDAGYCKHYD